jgi:hypothetical protein
MSSSAVAVCVRIGRILLAAGAWTYVVWQRRSRAYEREAYEWHGAGELE